MNRIVVERNDGESVQYVLKATPQVDKHTGRLTISDGRVAVVFNVGQWNAFVVEPLSEEQIVQLQGQVAKEEQTD
jgi:uncharacterized protein (DUF1330 family)